MEIQETDEQKSKRVRTGMIVAIVSVCWWVISIGGIIWTINAQS